MHTILPDSSPVPSYNEADLTDINLDDWLVIDSTGTTTNIIELLPPPDDENNNLLDSLIDQNIVYKRISSTWTSIL